MLAQPHSTSSVIDRFEGGVSRDAGRRKRAINLFPPGGRKINIFRPLCIFQRPAEAAVAGHDTSCGRLGMGPEINGSAAVVHRVEVAARQAILPPFGKPADFRDAIEAARPADFCRRHRFRQRQLLNSLPMRATNCAGCQSPRGRPPAPQNSARRGARLGNEGHPRTLLA